MAQRAFAVDGKVKQLSDLVRDRMTSKPDREIVEFGPVFGQLDEQSMKQLDDNTKMMIAGVTRQISRIAVGQRDFENMTAQCRECPLVEAAGSGISKADVFHKGDNAVWKTDGPPDDAIVQEVHAWLHKLVDQSDILKGASLDTVEDVKTAIAKRGDSESYLDVAGIIYPQPGKPTFRVFRIHLTVHLDSDWQTGPRPDQNGIIGGSYFIAQQSIPPGPESVTLSGSAASQQGTPPGSPAVGERTRTVRVTTTAGSPELGTTR